ncbi:MAG: hypothetical protein QM783_05515 [Phycisphaerales bacterium]
MAATVAVGVGWLVYLASFAVLVQAVYAPADARGSGVSAACTEAWFGNGVLMMQWTGDLSTKGRPAPAFRTEASLQLIASPAWTEGVSRSRGYVTIDWDKSYGWLRLSLWTYAWPDEVRGLRAQAAPLHNYVTATSPPWVRRVATPLWPVVLGSTGLVVWRWRRRRRLAAEDGCPGCGYSLRGLAEGAACPECGSRVPRG